MKGGSKMHCVSIPMAIKLKEAGLVRPARDICVGDMFCSGYEKKFLTASGKIVTGYEYEEIKSLNNPHLDYISFHWYWLPTAEDIEHKLQAMGMNYNWRFSASPAVWYEYNIFPSQGAVWGQYKENTVTAPSRVAAAGKALLELLLAPPPEETDESSAQDSVLNYTLRDLLSLDEQQVISLLTKLRDLITINK